MFLHPCATWSELQSHIRAMAVMVYKEDGEHLESQYHNASFGDHLSCSLPHRFRPGLYRGNSHHDIDSDNHEVSIGRYLIGC